MLSILHRFTGIALSAGSLVLALWFYAAAYDPKLFREVSEFFTGTLGKILLAGWSIAFYYHFFNGIRHLVWDAGYGYRVPVMVKTGLLTLIATALATVLTWVVILGDFA